MIPEDKAIIKNEGPGYEPLPEGLYNFEIADIYELSNVATKFGVKDFILVYCVVLNKEHRGEVVIYQISKAFTAGFEGGSSSHLYDLACAVTDDILDDTEPFDINSLVEGVFLGKVINKESGGRTYTNIVKTKAARGAMKRLDEEEKKEALTRIGKIQTKMEDKQETAIEKEAFMEEPKKEELTEDVAPEEIKK